ncbi:hypothetical protein EUX98_g4907 [Antrodiella citrinella]|uniref:Uncharacterized protein n=1 Tax=Antrodiella citrinella TaxID=2447956 RepID=A0A4S4MSY6_9APHY|nr:hypothetical protein EUX98_g4907 [Antrodiella citrinella]
MIIDKLESPTSNEAPAFPEKSDQFTPDLAPVEPQLRPPVASGSGAYAPPSELPPPYVVRSNPVVDELRPRAEPSRANSHLQPVAEQEVNHLVLESKNTPISGSYLLNCELPSTFPPRARRKVALDSRNKKLFHKDPPPPTASVRTRHGDIKLNLATAGPTESLNKAHVQVSTRNAKVHVNVHSLQENKHICLEVSTRDGE